MAITTITRNAAMMHVATIPQIRPALTWPRRLRRGCARLRRCRGRLAAMTLLADLVATSQAVAATPKRSEKVAALAALLRSLAPEEIAPAVGLLVGAPRQGRLGVGWAHLSATRPAPVTTPALTIGDVDAGFSRLAAAGGVGSQ